MYKYVNDVHQIANNATFPLAFNVNKIIKLIQLLIYVNIYVQNFKLSGSHHKINALTALNYLDLVVHNAVLTVTILINLFF